MISLIETRIFGLLYLYDSQRVLLSKRTPLDTGSFPARNRWSWSSTNRPVPFR
jgi:hypothetical protein